MKSYPSIPKRLKDEPALVYIFNKLDGNNLRFEWSKKKGWHKFGTRTRLFDETDKEYGPAIPLFHKTVAPSLDELIRMQGWQRVIVFCEYWGKLSISGYHQPGDEMFLSVIDIAPYKEGILGPSDFRIFTYNHGIPHAAYLGIDYLDDNLRQKVYEGQYPGVTFEGVVVKRIRKNQIEMAKIKTKKWIDEIMSRFGNAAYRILEG